MAWSYDVLQLGTSKVYQVRFAIGDTDTADQLLQDEEIAFLLSNSADDVQAAAVSCCEIISRNFSKKASYSLGPYSVNFNSRANEYRRMTADFKKQRALTVPPIMATPHEAIFDIDMMNSISPDAPLGDVEED